MILWLKLDVKVLGEVVQDQI